MSQMFITVVFTVLKVPVMVSLILLNVRIAVSLSPSHSPFIHADIYPSFIKQMPTAIRAPIKDTGQSGW